MKNESMTLFQPQSLGEVHNMFAKLIPTGFLPQHIKTPEQAVAITLLAQEMNIPMMTAVNNMHVVHGRVGLTAGLIVALVLKSGLCEYWTTIESTDKIARIKTKRKGNPDDHIIKFTWEEAVQRGVVNRNPNYKTMPEVMLLRRCETKAARQVYQDVVHGLYDADELNEMPAVQHIDKSAPGDVITTAMHESKPLPPADTDTYEARPNKATIEYVQPTAAGPVPDLVPADGLLNADGPIDIDTEFENRKNRARQKFGLAAVKELHGDLGLPENFSDFKPDHKALAVAAWDLVLPAQELPAKELRGDLLDLALANAWGQS